MQGWIRLYRKILNSSIWGNPQLLKLFLLCLLRANYTQKDVMHSLETVKLEKGQFLTGRFELTDDYNRGAVGESKAKDRTLWRWMKVLEKGGFLSIKSTTKYSVVTIKNWELYQPNVQEMSNELPSNAQILTAESPSFDTQLSTDNKDNKINNKKNRKKEKNSKNEDSETASSKLPSKVYEKFYQCFDVKPNSYQTKNVLSFLDYGMDEELILKAFEKAGLSGAKYTYAQSILNQWNQQGKKTLIQIEDELKKYPFEMEKKLNENKIGRRRPRISEDIWSNVEKNLDF